MSNNQPTVMEKETRLAEVLDAYLAELEAGTAPGPEELLARHPDLAADLRFGTGLDNQRAVTVKSTFLQNRSYLDFYYREAFTVVEMETGPYCNAVYEIADADRHPVNEAVNFSKLPIDLGIIHYASDTPYTQARTLGARGLSYYGMDSTYASSLAILRRIFRLEGALA